MHYVVEVAVCMVGRGFGDALAKQLKDTPLAALKWDRPCPEAAAHFLNMPGYEFSVGLCTTHYVPLRTAINHMERLAGS